VRNGHPLGGRVADGTAPTSGIGLMGEISPGVAENSDRVVTMYLGRIVEQAPAQAVPLGARHPYTRALFSATPGLISPINPIPLVGAVPSATRPPSGCPFRTRCWRADDLCAAEMPAGQTENDHLFHCHHPVAAGATDVELIQERV
jgi:peptide/nickel transport system ATP-binding protein